MPTFFIYEAIDFFGQVQRCHKVTNTHPPEVPICPATISSTEENANKSKKIDDFADSVSSEFTDLIIFIVISTPGCHGTKGCREELI